ncbi:hypothetical protein D3C72_694270 [compost metagenome]
MTRHETGQPFPAHGLQEGSGGGAADDGVDQGSRLRATGARFKSLIPAVDGTGCHRGHADAAAAREEADHAREDEVEPAVVRQDLAGRQRRSVTTGLYPGLSVSGQGLEDRVILNLKARARGRGHGC